MNLLDDMNGIEGIDLTRPRRRSTYLHTSDSAVFTEDYRATRCRLAVAGMSHPDPRDIGYGIHIQFHDLR